MSRFFLLARWRAAVARHACSPCMLLPPSLSLSLPPCQRNACASCIPASHRLLLPRPALTSELIPHARPAPPCRPAPGRGAAQIGAAADRRPRPSHPHSPRPLPAHLCCCARSEPLPQLTQICPDSTLLLCVPVASKQVNASLVTCLGRPCCLLSRWRNCTPRQLDSSTPPPLPSPPRCSSSLLAASRVHIHKNLKPKRRAAPTSRARPSHCISQPILLCNMNANAGSRDWAGASGKSVPWAKAGG